MKRLETLLAGLVLCAFSVGSVNAATLSLLPASQIAGNGDSVSVDLVIDGLGNFGPDSLGDFDIDIAYDTSVLTFDGYALSGFLGDIGVGEALDFSLGEFLPGFVNVTNISFLDPDPISGPSFFGPYLDDIQPGSFVLATFDFTVDSLPVGSSTIVSIDLVNALGDGFGLPLPVDNTNNAVISAVPIPAAAPLFGSAMGLLSFLGWRRRKASAAA